MLVSVEVWVCVGVSLAMGDALRVALIEGIEDGDAEVVLVPLALGLGLDVGLILLLGDCDRVDVGETVALRDRLRLWERVPVSLGVEDLVGVPLPLGVTLWETLGVNVDDGDVDVVGVPLALGLAVVLELTLAEGDVVREGDAVTLRVRLRLWERVPE